MKLLSLTFSALLWFFLPGSSWLLFLKLCMCLKPEHPSFSSFRRHEQVEAIIVHFKAIHKIIYRTPTMCQALVKFWGFGR